MARSRRTCASASRSASSRARGGEGGYGAAMSTVRIALATLRYPDDPDDSVAQAERAIAEAGRERAQLVCFPECYVPGYRGLGHAPPEVDAAFLERAWTAIAAAAARAG